MTDLLRKHDLPHQALREQALRSPKDKQRVLRHYNRRVTEAQLKASIEDLKTKESHSKVELLEFVKVRFNTTLASIAA